MTSRYKKIVARLKQVLTQEEFLELQELTDGDADHILCELLAKEACKMAPHLFCDPFDKEQIHRPRLKDQCQPR